MCGGACYACVEVHVCMCGGKCVKLMVGSGILCGLWCGFWGPGALGGMAVEFSRSKGVGIVRVERMH